jgi:uncharacterized protein YegJ (DUF2314 family)
MLNTNAGDQAMNAAMDRARATFPLFVAQLNNPAGLGYVGAKIRLRDPDGVSEHIWLSDVTYADGKIRGKLTANAVLFPRFHAGDEVSVGRRELSDWMTVENGRTCGGFTTRIIAAEMTPKARSVFLAEMGTLRLPPGDSVCDDTSDL